MNEFFKMDQTLSSDRPSLNDASLAKEISKVYYWMFFGLLLTFSAAYYTATNQAMYNFIFGSYIYYLFLFAPLGIVLFLSARIHAMSANTAAILFLAYSLINGLTLATIFYIYSFSSLINVFAITSVTFLIMAFYGYTTKTDLTSFGKIFLFALVGIIIASIINIFLNSSTFDFVISIIGVILFTGLIAYDTQKIKSMIIENYQSTGSVSGRGVILGALSLYLDFLNLFLFLLRLLGSKDE